MLVHDIAHRMYASGRAHRDMLREEVRDAFPIATAGLPSAMVLALAVLGWLPAMVAQLIAAAGIVVRLAAIGAIVARFGQHRARRLAWHSGAVLAVVGAVIAVAKVWLLH